MGLRQLAERDPVGDHLQRADHPAAGAARAEGRQIPAGRPAGEMLRRNLPSTGSAALSRPFVGIKLDRPRRQRPRPRLRTRTWATRSRPRSARPSPADPVDADRRPRLSAGDHRHRARLVFPHQANGSLIRDGGRVDRLGADRPEFRRAALFPPAPVGRRRRLRRLRLVGLQSRPDLAGARRPDPDARRRGARRRA